MTRQGQGRRPFYGWVVLTGAMLVFFTSSGSFFWSYGVFLPVISDELAWGRTAVGAGLSIGLLCFGLPSPLIGASILKFGPRKNIILGNSFAAFGLFAMSQCQELWHLYFFFGGIVGLGAGFGMYLACTTLVNNWFVTNRSLSMGLLLASSALAGFVFPPLASWLIDIVGWQATWIVFGGMNLLFAVLIGGVILIRNMPEDIGQVPYGKQIITVNHSTGKDLLHSDNQVKPTDWHIRQVAKKPVFWLIVLVGATNFFALGTLNAHQVAYFRDIGFSAMVAAMFYSLVSVMSIVGRFGLGALALRFEVRRLAVFSFVLQLCAFIILLVTENLGFLYLYAIFFGVSCGAIVVALPTFVTEYFGTNRYALIMGFILPLGLAAESTGPIVAGAMYDVTSTYTFAFILLISVSLLGLACAVFLPSPKPQ